jgi:hypothetical protein
MIVDIEIGIIRKSIGPREVRTVVVPMDSSAFPPLNLTVVSLAIAGVHHPWLLGVGLITTLWQASQPRHSD